MHLLSSHSERLYANNIMPRTFQHNTLGNIFNNNNGWHKKNIFTNKVKVS